MQRRTRRICAHPDCGETFVPSGIGSARYCPAHTQLHRDRKSTNPEIERQRQRIYSSKRWKTTRKKVLDRDGYQCVICGATELEQRLVVDHIHGVLNVADPYDPEECQTLCLHHSGKKDGARAHRGAST